MSQQKNIIHTCALQQGENMGLKKNFSGLWGFIFCGLSLLPTYALANIVLAEVMPCAVLLDVEVYDEVRPRGAHLQKLLGTLRARPDLHEIRSVDGNIISLSTLAPEAVLVSSPESMYITRITREEKVLPLFYEAVPSSDLPRYARAPLPTTDREKLFRLMALLPAGLYELHSPTGETFSFIVRYLAESGSRPFNQLGSEYAIVTELWPGLEFLPRTESNFLQSMIAFFDNRRTVAESVSITFNADRVAFSSSIQHALIRHNLELVYDAQGNLTQLSAHNVSYDVLRFYQFRNNRL